MHVLAIVPAVLFLALTGWVNVLFAGIAGTDDTTRAMWLALGLACATYTALSPFLVSEQWRRRRFSRCAAAALLAVGCIAFDVIAGLAVHKHLKQAHVAAFDAERRAYDTLQTEAQRAERYAESLVAPGVLEARAAVASLLLIVSDAQCAEVFGPNKLSAVAANRIRAKCGELMEARQGIARAEAREAAISAAKTARAAADAAEAPATTDNRAAFAGEAVALWLPVLLVTGGALLATFAATVSDVERKPAKSEAPKPEPAKVSSAIDRLQGLLDLPSAAPKGVTVDTVSRRIKGTQRPLAKFAGVPLSRLNSELQSAAGIGRVHVDTSDGTTITFN